MAETTGPYTVAGEAPSNERPAVLDLGEVLWQGDGIAIAVPSALVYTSGIELTIIGRRETPLAADIERSRETSKALAGLKVNGTPVSLLQGHSNPDGFTYRAWVPFVCHGSDLVFALTWPDIPSREYLITQQTVEAAVGNVIRLWPQTPGR